MILKAAIAAGLLLFLIGIVIRVVRIAAMPVHVRWELYPIPKGTAAKTRVMLSEILLLKGVYEQNRLIWLWSWIFHVAFYLLIFAGVLSLIASFNDSVLSSVTPVIAILSNIAYVGGAMGSAGLIFVRLLSRKFRSYTSPAALVNLALVLGIFLSGLVHAFLQPAAAEIMVKEAGSIFGLTRSPSLHPAAIVHLSLIAVFLAYFPATQMAHALLKYFTYHSVRWDDRPVRPGEAERVRGYLTYPVSWSGPHIQRGERNWMDLLKTDSGTSRESGVQPGDVLKE